jgi:UDP-N-acetyl-2-amino-2-deoxyglucuronate dehydrogenase
MTPRKVNFAIVGVAGYIAPRHLAAIEATGNTLVAACDLRDSVGILDRYSLDAEFTTDPARFEALLARRNRGPSEDAIGYVSVCSPNDLHVDHCRAALIRSADVICEKPLAIDPGDLDTLEGLERKHGRRVFTVLQLRVRDELIALRRRVLANDDRKHEVVLTYVTGRGSWYRESWKGAVERSGGIATNIGIHLFDLLMWLFGQVQRERVYLSEPTRMSGTLELSRARVRWFLSVAPEDVPGATRSAGRATFRSITVDGEEVEFSEGFTGLHTRVYESILAGHGVGIEEARPSIELTYRLRHAKRSPLDGDEHSMLVPSR